MVDPATCITSRCRNLGKHASFCPMNDTPTPAAIFIMGHISSGKTTLASHIARTFGIEHISSDGVRAEVGASRTFTIFRSRVLWELYEKRSVVLDSTGMSPKLPRIVEDIRNQFRPRMAIIQLYADWATWGRREAGRTDREQLGQEVYHRDLHVKPDVMIDTSSLDPQEVFCKAWSALLELNALP